MKILKATAILLVLVFSSTTAYAAADPFAVQTAGTAGQTNHASCFISVAAGDVLEFSAADLERRMGIVPGGLGGITVTTLPDLSNGELLLDGVSVEAYDFLDRAALDRLCFAPTQDAITTNISLLPKSKQAVTTDLIIDVLAQQNMPPQVSPAGFETMKNVAISGSLEIFDPEGDDCELKVISAPKKGTVIAVGNGFRYQPYPGATGADSFTVCAVDVFSNYSKEALVEVNIENTRGNFYYEDMRTNPSNYAAIKLNQYGVITGKKIGDDYFFLPNDMTERGDFLIQVLTAAGFTDIRPAANTGLPNDSEIPGWLKPYVKKAVDEKLWSGAQAFYYREIPTRAEAVILVDRASKIKGVKSFELTMPDSVSIPSWARQSYENLAAYKMLDLYEGTARPTEALTNSYSADLVWQLYKHKHR